MSQVLDTNGVLVSDTATVQRWELLIDRANSVSFDRVANCFVRIGLIDFPAIWDEPYQDQLGISTSDPVMTLLAVNASIAGITKGSEGIQVIKGGVNYVTTDAELDSEGVIRCPMRRA